MGGPVDRLDPVVAARQAAGRELARLRRGARLSQQQLGSRIGYSRGQVGGAEAGTQRTAEPFWRRCDEVLGARGALKAAYDRIEGARKERDDQARRRAEAEREARLQRWRAQHGLPAATLPHDRVPGSPEWTWESAGLSGSPMSWTAQQRSPFLRFVAKAIRGVSAVPAAGRVDSDLADRLGGTVEGAYRVDAATVDDMQLVIAAYRRSYRQLAAHSLLPQAIGHLALTAELVEAVPSTTRTQRLVSIIGEGAMLAGTLSLHDCYDFDAARAYYQLSKRAIDQAENRELAAYLLGCMSFLAAYGGKRQQAVAMAQRSQVLAARSASPRTQGWLHAVAAEVHATTGQARLSLSALDASANALDRADQDDPLWIGIGAFDHAKLTGYRGTCYLRLARWKDAHDALSTAIQRLRPSFLKHRSTALADLADALVGMGEIDEACERASEALAIAGQIQHAITMRRIHNVRSRMERWKDTAAVKTLDEQLLLV